MMERLFVLIRMGHNCAIRIQTPEYVCHRLLIRSQGLLRKSGKDRRGFGPRHANRPNAGRGEIKKRRGGEQPVSVNIHPTPKQFFLPLPADLGQNDLSAIAFDLSVFEHGPQPLTPNP